MKDVVENALKNRVFFGISILKGFWVDFERVLGGQNPRFSHFFRCFFEVIFEARLGRAKNRPKRPNKTEMVDFCLGIPVVPPPPGERQREGIKNLGLHNELGLSDSRAVMGRAYLKAMGLVISHASHTFGGRRIEGPQGGTPPPPTRWQGL